MDPKLEHLKSNSYMSRSSPLLVPSSSPHTRILLKTSNLFLQTADWGKKVEQVTSKNVQLKQATKKLRNLSTPMTGDFVVKKKKAQVKPSIGEKYATLAKVNQRQNKFQAAKKDIITEENTPVINFNETFLRQKNPNNNNSDGKFRVTPVSLNSQVKIRRVEHENHATPEPLTQKTQDKYTHFKKTISSFWPKTTLANNLGMKLNQRSNSAATMVPPIALNQDHIESHRYEPEEQEKRIMLTKQRFLSFSKVPIGDYVRVVQSTNVTPKNSKAGTKVDKGCSVDMGNSKVVMGTFGNYTKLSMSKTDSMFYYCNKSKTFKFNESRFSNDDDMRNESVRYKDSINYSLANEYRITNTPLHQFQPRHQIKEEDDFPYESRSSSRMNPFIDSPLPTPHSSHSHHANGHYTPLGTKGGLQKKLKDMINPNFGLESQSHRQSEFKLIRASDLRSTSFNEKTMLLPSGMLDFGGDPNRKVLNRVGTISLGFDKNTRMMAEKSLTKLSPCNRNNESERYEEENVEQFELEGWEQDTDGY